MKTSSFFRGLAVLSVLLAGASIAAGDPSPRPRVGLVLGGGGARGAAHVGVLEVLEQLRVPVDCVAGTSMGALAAGAFAAGLSPTGLPLGLQIIGRALDEVGVLNAGYAIERAAGFSAAPSKWW